MNKKIASKLCAIGLISSIVLSGCGKAGITGGSIDESAGGTDKVVLSGCGKAGITGGVRLRTSSCLLHSKL